jgi:hypothetical protein
VRKKFRTGTMPVSNGCLRSGLCMVTARCTMSSTFRKRDGDFARVPSARKMRLALSCLLALLFIASGSAIGDDNSWTKQTFHASPDAVFSAARIAISKHHDITDIDLEHRTIYFRVGYSLFEWRYSMIASVESSGGESTVLTIIVDKSKRPSFSWGTGKREIRRIFKWTDHELAAGAR